MVIEGAEAVLDGFVEAVFKVIIENHHRHVVELDLTLSQAQTLRILRRAPLLTTRLAAELRISAPAVTQLTDRLVRKQLIDRKPVAGDRRMVLLSLTVRGKGIVDGFKRNRNEVFADALGHLNQSDRVEVIDALRKISWALGAEAPRPEPVEPSLVTNEGRPPEPAPEASNLTAGARPVPMTRRIRMEWD
ncbi:MAG: MarR family transcriptional regulator [Blastocatellia bacterium]